MRIKEIFLIISKCKIIVDVGSDHALLSKMLIDNNVCDFVYNIEKNELPFQNSVNNTKDLKYLNRIINIKSDGFISFDSSIDIDYCCLSGLGAKTIIDIISKCKNKIEYFLICSNNENNFLIRKWAKKNKYKITVDKTILDKKKYYEIICLSKNKGYKLIWNNEIYFGKSKMKKNDSLYLSKLKNDYENSKHNINVYKINNREKYLFYKKLFKIIKKYEHQTNI